MKVTIAKNRAGIITYKPAEKQIDRLEKYEQQDLNSHCEVLWPEQYASMFHIVNESNGKSRPQYEESLNRQGRKRGVSDWMVLVPVGGFHGLILELKRCHTGSVSKEQKEFLLHQQSLGYKCVVAYGFRAALEAIKDYLNNA